MKRVVDTLHELKDQGLIKNWSLCGSHAAMRYIDPFATLDLDVLVTVTSKSELNPLGDVFDFLESKGYEFQGEGIVIDDWPVQFLVPAKDSILFDSLEHADEFYDDEVGTVFCMPAEYLVAEGLQVNRPKDRLRVLALLQEPDIVDRKKLDNLLSKYNMEEQWLRITQQFPEIDSPHSAGPSMEP